ncbi:MAG: recombination mediator RecR [Alphaproteobacteria bacterium]
MANDIIDGLIRRFSKLPGLGPSSAKRLVLHLLKDKENSLNPLVEHLQITAEKIQKCTICGNLDAQNPCGICHSDKRDKTLICVVENVADLWAMERTMAFFGQYHVLDGVLSALEGVHPQDLRIPALIERCKDNQVSELIIATSATVDGQATAHYIASQFVGVDIKISALAQGVPMGGELDWLDDGTISKAFQTRHKISH